MNIKINILIAGLLAGALSCTIEEYTQEAANIPVIQAFLTPGQLPEVSLTRIIPYAAESGDTVAVPLSGLSVSLTVNGNEFVLTEDSAGSGTYVPVDPAFMVKAGDTILFKTDYMGVPVTASTVVPSPVASLSMTDDALFYSSGSPQSWLSAGEIDLTWHNPEESFYYITVENIEDDPTPLNEMAENMPKFGSSPPSRGNEFRIGMRNVTYFGTHRVIVYHVNSEFAELFDNPGMSSVSMAEPPTNINNGLGIFTSMNTDTVYFKVYKQ
jgi:hypothetical protein